MPLNKRLRFAILERDDFTCRYCGRNDGPLEVDHVIPESLGGRDVPENLVAACRDCNRGKGALCTKVPEPTEKQLELSKALRDASPGDVRDIMKAIRPVVTGRVGGKPTTKRTVASLTPEVMNYRRQLLAHVGRGFTLDDAVEKKMAKAPQDARLINMARMAIMQERQIT